MLKDLIKIGFPTNCLSCSNSLVDNELFICSKCYFFLPKGELALDKTTETAALFSDEPHFLGSGHLLDFDRDGKTQHILHELKYNSNIQFGNHLGKLMGQDFLPLLKEVDYLVPVPLHPKKEHQRGYNQSLVLCKGIESVTDIKIAKKALIRTRYTETQTKKSKTERIENMKNAFELADKTIFENKTICLVDDVVTTGSTLKECLKILGEGKAKVKILLLAKTNY